MNLRSKTILEAAIKEYIKSGQPVSSKELANKYDFGVKWASVRSELGKLTKEGFLAQLHTSGGRVPTDKGYQFFVAQTLDDAVDSKKILSRRHGGVSQRRYGELIGDLQKGNLRDFVEDFSEETKLLGVGQKEKDREVYKSGLDELFGKLDLRYKKEFYEIVKDFEMLDRRLEAMRSRLFHTLSAPQVFIGKKSPITKSGNLSVILDKYEADGQRILIAVIGPKRMDYDKNLKLFKRLHDCDE